MAAREAITISGQSRLDVSGLYSNAFSSGEAGRLAVATPLLTMDNSLIQAVAAADSRGNAGGLDVQVGRLMLTGGAQIDSGTRAGSTGVAGADGHGERGHRHQRAGQLGRERAVQ